uniref:Putative LOC100897181 [Metaseiulus occidentalis] n=1 Tax=Lepeophtheirus salmonis TaxID=72036 RepID=A0A0K2T0Z0_LEPSM
MINFWVVLISLILKVSNDYRCCCKKYQHRSCLLFQGERLKVFITTGALYCIKAIENLKQHFPIMLHITCLAHRLNRIATL